MSIAAMSWAFEQELPPNEKIVLLSLADCENGQTYVCIPGQERIATMSSMSVRSVQRMLVKLEERGLIKRDHRDRGTGRTSDSYVLIRHDRLSGGVPSQATTVSGAQATTVSGIREPEDRTGSTKTDVRSTPEWQDRESLWFEKLWDHWPKKTAKKAARVSFDKLAIRLHHQEDPLRDICAKLAGLGLAHMQFTPPQFQPMLSTIINGERWDDPLPTARAASVSGYKTVDERNEEFYRRQMEASHGEV